MGKSKFTKSGADKARAVNYSRLKNERHEDDDFERLALDLTQGVSVKDVARDYDLLDEEDENDIY